MKTDQLIGILAADAASRAPDPRRTMVALGAGGVAITAILFALFLGPRADFMAAATTWRFVAKFAVFAALASAAGYLALALARPAEPARGAPFAVALAPLMLAILLAIELASTPAGLWSERLIGSNLRVCLTAIPLLSLAPLAAILWGLRVGAPTRPTLTGAVAGLAASSAAALLYAAHCTDDSPLFVAVWYSASVGLVTVVGAILGRRLLRW